eukprot:548838_1
MSRNKKIPSNDQLQKMPYERLQKLCDKNDISYHQTRATENSLIQKLKKHRNQIQKQNKDKQRNNIRDKFIKKRKSENSNNNNNNNNNNKKKRGSKKTRINKKIFYNKGTPF